MLTRQEACSSKTPPFLWKWSKVGEQSPDKLTTWPLTLAAGFLLFSPLVKDFVDQISALFSLHPIMTALPKNFSASSSRSQASGSAPSRRRRNLQVVTNSPAQFPVPELPTALKVLQDFQQTTSFVTFLLVFATLGFYGWTVYTPIRWTQEYNKLQHLQQSERQLRLNTEALKQQLALQAEKPGSGLVKVAPQQNIFLPAAPSPLPKKTKVASVPRNLPLENKPLSY